MANSKKAQTSIVGTAMISEGQDLGKIGSRD